jgi:hypothetical protein
MSVATQAAALADAPAAPVLPYRVGHGFDLHRLAEGYKLVIGGVEIPHIKGCEAHSDGKLSCNTCAVAAVGRLQTPLLALAGDVLLHTVTDAILGALSLPDIGKLHIPASWGVLAEAEHPTAIASGCAKSWPKLLAALICDKYCLPLTCINMMLD